MRRAVRVILCLAALSAWDTGTTRAAEFDDLLGNTCEPGDLRPGLHDSWRSYCRRAERQAYDRYQSIAGVVSRDIWSECAASVVKPKGLSFVEVVNCVDRALDNLPSAPRNTAVLSRQNRPDKRFWTLAECQDAQKADGGVCIAR